MHDVPLGRVDQVHQLVRKRNAVTTEIPEPFAQQDIPAAAIPRRMPWTMNWVPHLLQPALGNRLIDVVGKVCPTGATAGKPRIQPVRAKRQPPPTCMT